MAKNFIQPGNAIEWTAPAGGVLEGRGVKIGSGTIVIANNDAAAGERFLGHHEGVWLVDKPSANVWAEGATVYWDDTAKNFTAVSTSNTRAGAAVEAAGSGTTKGKVRLNGSAMAS